MPSANATPSIEPTEVPEAAASPLSSSAPSERLVTQILGALIICASAIMVMWNLQDTSLKNSNTGSRYATVEALVDFGTFAINDSVYNFTIDKIKIDKNYYSSKPPTLPTLAAGVYWVHQKLTGKTIATDEGDVLWVIGMCTGWLSHVVLLIYFFKLGLLLFKRQLAQLGSLVGVAFGCLSVAFSTTLNNHSIGATLVFACFYHTVCARRAAPGNVSHYVFAGLYAGFGPAIDLPSAIMSSGAFVLLGLRDWRKTFMFFVPAVLPGAATALTLSYLSSGSIEPVYLRTSLYKYAGSYWNNRSGIEALREPKHIYGFHALFGHHGLFSMTPLLGFGAWALYRELRKRSALFQESLLVAIFCLALLTFYIIRTRNYGGWSVGMRWFVPFMPLLMFYFGLWLDRVLFPKLTTLSEKAVMSSKWGLVVLSLGVSAFHVQDGLTCPFQFSRWHNWLDGKPNRNRQAAKLNLGRSELAVERERVRLKAQGR
ncbi:MAG: hypothetical protein RJA70_789 [Pseudomonadota bacterium]|jgi:hypothetical protein